MKPRELRMDELPGHVDPGLGLGDILNYSGLVSKLISAFVSLKSNPVGGAVDMPLIETWLPSLGEYDLTIHAVRKA